MWPLLRTASWSLSFLISKAGRVSTSLDCIEDSVRNDMVCALQVLALKLSLGFGLESMRLNLGSYTCWFFEPGYVIGLQCLCKWV